MQSNALLVRWAGGWHERIDEARIATWGRIEARLDLGALDALNEVKRVADGQLDEFGETRQEITVSTEPATEAEEPYLGYTVGDRVVVPIRTGGTTTERVMSITVTEDRDTGRAISTPTVKDMIIGTQERLMQDVKKMTNGTFRGNSKVAQPAVPERRIHRIAYRPSADFTCCFSATVGTDTNVTVVPASTLVDGNVWIWRDTDGLYAPYRAGRVAHWVEVTVSRWDGLPVPIPSLSHPNVSSWTMVATNVVTDGLSEIRRTVFVPNGGFPPLSGGTTGDLRVDPGFNLYNVGEMIGVGGYYATPVNPQSISVQSGNTMMSGAPLSIPVTAASDARTARMVLVTILKGVEDVSVPVDDYVPAPARDPLFSAEERAFPDSASIYLAGEGCSGTRAEMQRITEIVLDEYALTEFDPPFQYPYKVGWIVVDFSP